ncbi:MAG TPA: TetR/AcrR family transcriptional regulator [Pseudonocardiaceae bacterium]|nr:TetR/AcrR family transcriptional regulator [Pseudonocardiaceae bacterium]
MTTETAEEGLRERKKRATRQRIADLATMLFMERGFENVTVAEIAAAANVSKMTVFNYFPRKEDMFFDRGQEAADLISRAVLDRPPGTGVSAALRALLLDLLARRHPLGGLRDGVDPFWQTVLDSPTLRAAARDSVDALEDLLAGLYAQATGARPDDPMPAVAAAFTVAAYRPLYLRTVRRLMAGERADDLYREQVALVNDTFDRLDRALAGYG